MAKFSVTYMVSGTMTDIIEADDLAAARKIVESTCYDDNWDPELESVDDVNFSIGEMHRIIRDGKVVHSTYVRSTDERAPLDVVPSE